MNDLDPDGLRALFDEDEWEALCDNCGLCCFYKIEDEDTEEVFFTTVFCPFLSLENQSCEVYPERFKRMPSCVKIAPETIRRQSAWMPTSCAYRCVAESRPIAPWHPLLHRSPEELALQPPLQTLREKLAALHLLPARAGIHKPSSHQRLKRWAKKGNPERVDFQSWLMRNVFPGEI